MLIGVIADDFTGASDIANTLAKGLNDEGGLRTSQYLGVPQQDPAPDEEACVIALKSRSIAPAEAVAQSLQALEWLRKHGCRQVVFKYCSTFDSTPEGNIGPVGEALAKALGVHGVVACPAFPAAGRTERDDQIRQRVSGPQRRKLDAQPHAGLDRPDACHQRREEPPQMGTVFGLDGHHEENGFSRNARHFTGHNLPLARRP